jgi:DNA-binding transcriptional MocR family regulator
MRDYRTVADALAADITSGKLAPGTRLSPQRAFAYERRIAVSTASRVYAELVMRAGGSKDQNCDHCRSKRASSVPCRWNHGLRG